MLCGQARALVPRSLPRGGGDVRARGCRARAPPVVAKRSSKKKQARKLEKRDEVKEMEAAAVAWVCELHDTPLVAVKTITDLVDHRDAACVHVESMLRDGCARFAVEEVSRVDDLAWREAGGEGAVDFSF